MEINGIPVKKATTFVKDLFRVAIKKRTNSSDKESKAFINIAKSSDSPIPEISNEVRDYFYDNWDVIGEVLKAYNRPLNVAQRGNKLLLNTGAYTSSLNLKDVDFSDKASDKIMDTIIDNLVMNKKMK